MISKKIRLMAIASGMFFFSSCGDTTPKEAPLASTEAPATVDPVHSQCPLQARCSDGSMPEVNPSTCQITVPCKP